MWIIKFILDADYGCEERAEGEGKKALVILEDEEQTEISIEVEESYLDENDLFEGCEWPEEIETNADDIEKYRQQMEWMENYLNDQEILEE